MQRPIKAKIPPVSKLRKRFESLDERERLVFDFVFNGYKGREISKALGLSLRSVETCKASISFKLGAPRTAIAVRYAVAIGWPAGLSDPTPRKKWGRRGGVKQA